MITSAVSALRHGRFQAAVRSLIGLLFLLNPWPILADEAPAPTFPVWEFRVLGNTVLDARAIERAVTPFLGPDKTLADVESARAALEAAYRAEGYGTVFVDIPEQSVDDGIVRLRATEGRLSVAKVAGSTYSNNAEIRAAVPEAAVGKVPSLTELQKEITSVNAVTPDRQVVPVLKAGAEPGTVDLALNVEDHLPFHGSVELNNQHTARSRPLRLATNVSYDNMFDRHDSLSLQYLMSPQETKDVKVFAAGYVARVPDGKLSFSYINNSSSVPIASAASIGKGRTYGVHYDRTLEAQPAVVQDLTVGLEYKRTEQSTPSPSEVPGASSSLSSPVNYLVGSILYSGMLISPERLFTWSIGPSFGVRGVGSSALDFDNKRYLARANFTLLRGEASYTRHLPHGLDAVLRAGGQFSEQPLLPNEQFVIGGVGSVRGYYEAEELGDLGLKLGTELRGPSLFSRFEKLSERASLRPLAFLEGARVGTQDALPGSPTYTNLSSAGLGLDLEAWHFLTGNLTWAQTFNDGTNTGARTLKGAHRWLFSVKAAW